MAKESHKELYSVDDIVVIYRRLWKIEVIYHKERRYRVRLLNPDTDDMWTEFYPEHNEITCLWEV